MHGCLTIRIKTSIMMFVSVSRSFFFILSAVLGVLLSTSTVAIADDDGVYMSKLLNALTPTPTGWSHDTNFCTWGGVHCNDQSGRVTYIDLPSRLVRLKGTIPSDLNSLSDLTYLNLASNSLTGPLPSLANLTRLKTVYLDFNTFTGPIPDLSNCTYLFDLQLYNNTLTGMVPPSLMSLSVLKNVSLANNRLQGPIPVFLQTMKVDLSGNSFCRPDVGPCDSRVMTLLQIAAAFGYPLTLMDSWSGNDPCKYLRFIVCAPDGKIVAVDLEKQNLNGTISPAFANLTSLVNLTLSGNHLIGSIPESFTTLSQLELLDVSNNNLSGQVPKFPLKIKFITAGNAFLLQSSGNVTPGSSSKWNQRLKIVIGASTAGCATVLFFILIICYLKKGTSFPLMRILWKRRKFVDHYVENFMQSYGSLVPKRYSYSEVKGMTNSFQNKLGQGGYGVVYKAKLPDGRLVAVKVITESKGSGEEFINEVASISKTSHVNIVALLGFCYDMNKRALIYEFMPNGSLDNFINGRRSPNVTCRHFDWCMLYKVAIGIARGLEYLHRGCNTRILHLDIKPQNILLDGDFCPKISDFGLAKICKKKESIVSILGTRGTPGYIAPEVYNRAYGGVSHKSDVYSYGMLILEMVGARKNYDSGGSNTSEMYFPDWIYKDLEQGNFPTNYFVITDEDNEIARKMILVSLWCIQTHPIDRPSMSKVMEMLEGQLQSIPCPPKLVLYSPGRIPLQISNLSSSNMQETNSITMQKDGSDLNEIRARG